MFFKYYILSIERFYIDILLLWISLWIPKPKIPKSKIPKPAFTKDETIIILMLTLTKSAETPSMLYLLLSYSFCKLLGARVKSCWPFSFCRASHLFSLPLLLDNLPLGGRQAGGPENDMRTIMAALTRSIPLQRITTLSGETTKASTRQHDWEIKTQPIEILNSEGGMRTTILVWQQLRGRSHDRCQPELRECRKMMCGP